MHHRVDLKICYTNDAAAAGCAELKCMLSSMYTCMQATMVATWLAELYLDRINRAVLEEGEGGEGGPRVAELTTQLRDFLKDRVELLDVRTTMTLLASYGRLDDLMHYASYRQVWRTQSPPASSRATSGPDLVERRVSPGFGTLAAPAWKPVHSADC